MLIRKAYRTHLSVNWKLLLEHIDILIMMGGYCLLAVQIYILPEIPGRLVSSLFCVFLAPGYLFLAGMYPDRASFRHAQNWFASVGMSVVITSLLLLIVAYTVGIDLNSSFLVLGSWAMLWCLIAVARRKQATTTAQDNLYLLRLIKRRTNYFEWHSYLILPAFALLFLAFSRLMWVSTQTEPQFSEFYVLGQDDALGNYPETVQINSNLTVKLGIVNQEKKETQYNLFYEINGNQTYLKTIILQDDEVWESEVSIPIENIQEDKNEKVTFFLVKPGESERYRSLYLWVHQ